MGFVEFFVGRRILSIQIRSVAGVKINNYKDVV